MAVVAHLVTRTPAGGRELVNDIAAVVIAIDDAVDTTAALIRARAVTVLGAAGIALPVGYFDANVAIATTFATAGEIAAFGPRQHAAYS